MTAQTGTYVQQLADGSGATAKGARLAQAGLLAKNADGTVKVGVLADGQGPVVTGAAGMTYNIRKHVAVTKVSEANGPTLVPNDGTVSVATDPAPGSNSRIDVIWVQQRHLVVDGGSDTVNTPLFGVAKGATAAVPAAPSIPTGALELARATVPAGTTATSGLTFTQGATTTVINGGPVILSGGGTLWGTPYDATKHTLAIFPATIVAVPSGSGNIDLLVLASKFKGVASVTCTYGDITTGREIATWIFEGTTLVAQLRDSSGALITSGGQRLNYVVHGWI